MSTYRQRIVSASWTHQSRCSLRFCPRLVPNRRILRKIALPCRGLTVWTESSTSVVLPLLWSVLVRQETLSILEPTKLFPSSPNVYTSGFAAHPPLRQRWTHNKPPQESAGILNRQQHIFRLSQLSVFFLE